MKTPFWWLLGKCGFRVGVDRLIQSLTHPSASHRKAACVALRGFRDPRAISLLVKLVSDQDDGVFCAACKTLGLYGACEANGLLYPVLNSDNKRRVRAARQALARLGEGPIVEPYLRYLRGRTTAGEEIKTIVRKGDLRLVELLIDRLDRRKQEDRKAAAALLARIGDEAVVTRLAQRLDTGRGRVKYELCLLLGDIRSQRAREPLRRQLIDKEPRVVCAACEALAKIPDRGDFDAIAGLLDGANRESNVRAAALAALVAVDRSRARDRVLERLGDHDGGVRCAACEAIPRVCDPRDAQATDELVKLLTLDQPVQVREAACRALGKLGQERAVEPLMKLLKQSAVAAFEQAVAHFRPVVPTSGLTRLLNEIAEFVRRPWAFPVSVPGGCAIQEALDQLGRGTLVAALRGVVCDGHLADLGLFRRLVRAGDLTAIDVLVDWWPAFDKGRKDPTGYPVGRISRALDAIESSLGANMRQLFCQEHRTRFQWRRLRSEGGYVARYPVCRTCEKAKSALTGVERAICVVDGSSGQAQPSSLVRQGPEVVARWAEVGMFDFDAVRIRAGERWEIEEFCLKVQKDGVQFPEHKPRYRRMECCISRAVVIPVHLLRNLEETFGRVRWVDE